jgi:hypothetical protein
MSQSGTQRPTCRGTGVYAFIPAFVSVINAAVARIPVRRGGGLPVGLRACVRARACMRARACVHACVHACVRAFARACARMRVRACLRARARVGVVGVRARAFGQI